MANHKSAVKKYKRDEKKRLINKMNKTKMRNKIKKFKKEIETGKMEEAKSMFPAVMSIIDKSNTKGTIHQKTASRYKSRLTALLNKSGS
ncbi:MAG: 30S ribosomal protein S20 [Candidatus Aminicenantes bacterium]|nr:30S ribosomal protein S20 [Candidatus Aminicenantes bacterium]